MLAQTITTAILLLNPSVPMHRAIEVARALKQHCPNGLHPIALAVMAVESNFDPHARSNTADFGLFQVHRPIASGVATDELMQIECNVNVGCSILYSSWYFYADKHPMDWYGFFHSNKIGPRQKYIKKVQSKLELIKHLF